EEERRLFYVGITRAERKLYISYAEERRRNGELLPARQSSFLDAIPDTMVDKKSTVKVRSSGRAMMRAGGSGFDTYGGRYGRGGGRSTEVDDFVPRSSASDRRPGVPVTGFA